MPHRHRLLCRHAGGPCGHRSGGPCATRGGARAHWPADESQDRRAGASKPPKVAWWQTRNRLCKTRYP
eukprot:990416-Alexandrium_andersonii.AAC.1